MAAAGGEAIQNLRSALDHIVYAASGERSGTQFPIFTDPQEFQANESRMLAGVPGPVKATIENAQPYRRNPNAPARAMLEGLRVLSHRDKHRTLATVVSAVYTRVSAYPRAWRSPGRSTEPTTFTASSEAELGEGDVQRIFGYEVRMAGLPMNLLKSIVHEVYRVLVECETGKALSPLARYPL